MGFLSLVWVLACFSLIFCFSVLVSFGFFKLILKKVPELTVQKSLKRLVIEGKNKCIFKNWELT